MHPSGSEALGVSYGKSQTQVKIAVLFQQLAATLAEDHSCERLDLGALAISRHKSHHSLGLLRTGTKPCDPFPKPLSEIEN